MFDGYLALGSTELINAARSEHYVAHQAPGMSFRRRGLVGSALNVVFGDNPYESPLVDDAPWHDPRLPETRDFFGFYPLEIQGLNDSTLGASVTELVGSGGVVNSQREASRQVRVHGLLVGATEAAVEAGLSWLGSILRDPGCSSDIDCGAGDLVYFRSMPDVAPMLWLADETDSQVERFGTLASGKRIVHRFTSHEAPFDMPLRVQWSGQWREGNTYIFGAVAPDGTVLEQSDPVSPIRRNYFPNPSLLADTEGLLALSGSTVDWVSSAGVNGRSGARVTGYGGVPELYGTGTYGSGVYGGVSSPIPAGYDFGAGDFGAGGFGGTAPDADTTDPAGLYSIVVMPPAGPVTVSIAVRSTAGGTIRLQVTDGNTSAILGETDAMVDDQWTRLAVPVTVGPTGLQFSLISTAGFDVDQVLVEVGSIAKPYFDGDTNNSGYAIDWEGPRGASPSIRRRLGHTFQTAREDGGWAPFITSLEGDTDGVRMTWWGRLGLTAEQQAMPHMRILHGVKCIQGPKVITRYNDKGGWYIDCDILLQAEIPTAYTPAMPIPAEVVATKHFIDTGDPAPLTDMWLYDPTGPTPTPAPAAPLLLPLNTTSITDWRRAYLEIPEQGVAETATTVPQLAITSGTKPLSNVRVRFHPNPFGFEADRVDPLNYCGEFLISYLPPRTRLVLNGVTEQATASQQNKATVSAGHLISSDIGGAPMVWPALSCGMGYVLTVDTPIGGSSDYDLELSIATRE